MINRVLIRSKIIQLVYAHCLNKGKSLEVSEKELVYSMSKGYDLYNYLLLLLPAITDYARKKIEIGKSKLQPTIEDLRPNTRFVENMLVAQLEANQQLRDFKERQKKSWDNHPEMVKALYDTIGECGDALSSFPIGKAQLLSEGSEITLISYSRATLTCRKALSQSGRSVDHIDLATIKPVDIQTIKESVLKTGRVIIVQDTPLAGSVGASVSAMITGDSEMFAALKKEILIISSMDYPIPFSRTLERAISPTTETVTQALESF